MTEDQDAKESQSDSGTKIFVNKSKDKKLKAQRPLTKIILRRLPPTMTEESFLEQVSPIPEHDHFYFAKPDPSLGNNLYSRAYINFVNVEDIFLFKDKFDGYIFLDERGVEYIGIVEYAPFQRIPKKKKKKDPKCSTIESDPIYQEFIENLNKDQEPENQPKLEYSYPVNDANEKKVQSTPLLDYLAARKQDKRGRDERRRRENDKRKMRIERKTKEVPIKEEDGGENEVKKIKSRDWEKNTESKDDYEKEGTVYESKVYKTKVTYNDKKKKENDKRDAFPNDDDDDSDRGSKKDKRDKTKDSPRETKSKKYSDTRKERLKNDTVKSEKQVAIDKIMSSDKSKSLNDDIKPFTQLPQVKTDDLSRIIDSMDKKMKIEDNNNKIKVQKEAKEDIHEKVAPKPRRNSMDSEPSVQEEITLKRQKSLNTDYRDKSTDREGSEEKDKSDVDRRPERRIRNKDRPSLVIYQPGMGKFSKQRLAKEKESQLPTAKSVNESEKKDT